MAERCSVFINKCGVLQMQRAAYCGQSSAQSIRRKKMVINKTELTVANREKVRGGEGTCKFTYLAPNETLRNTRLLAQIEIPPGASIGDHPHEGETEFYIILNGSGMVNDDGLQKKVKKGDVMITGNGSVHGIKNTGTGPLVMYAVIVGY
jgi:mannose-6-phosphate isomerase-like protein (cupin superfamily)